GRVTPEVPRPPGARPRRDAAARPAHPRGGRPAPDLRGVRRLLPRRPPALLCRLRGDDRRTGNVGRGVGPSAGTGRRTRSPGRGDEGRGVPPEGPARGGVPPEGPARGGVPAFAPGQDPGDSRPGASRLAAEGPGRRRRSVNTGPVARPRGASGCLALNEDWEYLRPGLSRGVLRGAFPRGP